MAAATNLPSEPPPPPAALDAIIGREPKVRLLRDLLSREQRLVNVTGVAGVGKTRLGVEVARQVYGTGETGVWWVPASKDSARRDRLPHDRPDLASLREADPGGLSQVLHHGPTLMVVDGLEGPGEDVAWILDVLAAHPAVNVVSTSRGPLHLPGEWVLPLEPLGVPEPTGPDFADLDGRELTPSEQLLVARVQRLRPTLRPSKADLAAVAAICRALDGIPLALEQAAFTCVVQSLPTVRHRLELDPFGLPAAPTALGGGVDLELEMRQVIATLGPDQQHLLGRLSLLPDFWSVSEAAEQLACRADEVAAVVHALLERGLLRSSETEAGLRFRVLNLLRPLTAPESSPESAVTA